MGRIHDDTRPIGGIITGGDCGKEWFVGKNNITSISTFQEEGQMTLVTWFEIQAAGVVVARVNAAHVEEIIYWH